MSDVPAISSVPTTRVPARRWTFLREGLAAQLLFWLVLLLFAPTTALADILCGDTNGDSKISAADALFALRSAVGTTSCPLWVCDYNGDGKIAASDALAILRKAVGQSVTARCPDFPTTPLIWGESLWGQVLWN